MSSIVLNRQRVGDKFIEQRLTVNAEGNSFEMYDYIMPNGYGDTYVSPDKVVDFMSVANGDIEFRISSKGGEVGSALVMYNRIKAYNKGSVTTIVDGYAFSSAGWVAMAGKKRVINTGGLFMMHNPMMYPEIKSQADIESVASQWNEHRNSILNIFEESTGLDRDTLSSMMDKETYLSADKAVEMGFFNSRGSEQANTSALNFFRDSLPAHVTENLVDNSDRDMMLKSKARILRKVGK
jgi:ATP-dependent Clp protease protease subunit